MDTKDQKLYTIKWIGYNSKPNYNRIWGALTMNDGRHFAFWGVVGKRLQFKLHPEWRISYLINQQHSKGYQKITIEEYEKKHPSFKDDLEVWCTTAILSDDLR